MVSASRPSCDLLSPGDAVSGYTEPTYRVLKLAHAERYHNYWSILRMTLGIPSRTSEQETETECSEVMHRCQTAQPTIVNNVR